MCTISDMILPKTKRELTQHCLCNIQTVFAISSDVENDGELKGDLEERLDEMVKTTMNLARSKT